MPITVTDELLKVPSAAKRLTVSEKCIWTWIAQKRLPIVRLGRAVRIPSSAVEQLINDGYQAAQRIA